MWVVKYNSRLFRCSIGISLPKTLSIQYSYSCIHVFLVFFNLPPHTRHRRFKNYCVDRGGLRSLQSWRAQYLIQKKLVLFFPRSRSDKIVVKLRYNNWGYKCLGTSGILLVWLGKLQKQTKLRLKFLYFNTHAPVITTSSHIHRLDKARIIFFP